ncbi:MAG: hypothetical protein II069_01440 [Oscillospiraceae bacterium]|nr:hypothetical protein [Oscillospiraceae bacterium]
MKLPIHRDAPAVFCDLCGTELPPGGDCYRINGETVCPDCLAEYARQVFAPYRETVGEGWYHG